MALYNPSKPDPELIKISQALSAPNDYMNFNELDALPAKYGTGTVLMISAALAATLALAGGQGLYVYYGAAWNKLG